MFLFFLLLLSQVLRCYEGTPQEVSQFLETYSQQNKIYYALTSEFTGQEQIKLVRNALCERANPNEILPISSNSIDTISRYAPPLAYAAQIRPEIIEMLVEAGANVNADVLIVESGKIRLISIPQFFIEEGLKKVDKKDSRLIIARYCAIIESLTDNGLAKDKVLRIIFSYKDKINKPELQLFLGILYHQLMAENDDFSRFINSINLFDINTFTKYSQKSWLDQYDIFGISPMAYALWEYDLTHATTIFINMVKMGVNIYQPFFKNTQIHPHRFIKHKIKTEILPKFSIERYFFDTCSWCENSVHISKMNPYECKHKNCSKCSMQSRGECLICSSEVSYYDILGISQLTAQEEIRIAVKKESLRFHPDKNKSKLAEEKMKLINICREVLTDPLKRREYDLLLAQKYNNS